MNHFYLRVKPSPDTIKVVISVSKKVSKKAVIRNLIRRRVRPIFQKFIYRLKPAEYFIVAQSGAGNVKGQELEKEIISLIADRL